MKFLNYPFMCSAWQKKPNFTDQIAEQTASRTIKPYAVLEVASG